MLTGERVPEVIISSPHGFLFSHKATLLEVPSLLQRVTVNTQHLHRPLTLRSLFTLARFHMLCTQKHSHLVSSLLKTPLSVCLSHIWGTFKCNIQKAAMLSIVLAAPNSVGKIYPITSKLWLFYTNAWLPTDASLLSSWHKLS